MNICLLTDDYMPRSTKVGALMMHELARELHIRGHNVTVVVPDPSLRATSKVGTFEEIETWRFKSGPTKNVSRIRRAVNELLLSYRAYYCLKSEIRANPQSLIIYYSPTIFWGAFVWYLKRKWCAKSYLVLRDFFPQWAVDAQILSHHSPITKFFRLIESINYSVADVIGVQSPRNLTVFTSQFNTKARVEVLYNWATPQSTIGTESNFRNRLGLDDKIVLVYGGNIGVAQDMSNIVRLADNMKTVEAAHFLLVGDGDEVPLIKKEARRLKLENLTLLPALEQSEYFQMLSECDIGLFSLNKEHKAHNFPGKLLGYLAIGLPILGSINQDNDLADVVHAAGAGLVSVNGDDAAFYKNAKLLVNDLEFRKTASIAAKRLLAEQFSVNAAADQLLDQ